MLLAHERTPAITTFVVPVAFQLLAAAVLKFNPKIEQDKTLGKFYRTYVRGISNPALAQLVFIIVAALIFEAIEMRAEEDANPEFVECTARFSRDECRQWRTHSNNQSDGDVVWERKGDPVVYPWRSFDFFGSAFFVFTLMTTIGYGTFAPATAGGRIFTVFCIATGVPLAAYGFGTLSNSIISIFFGDLLSSARLTLRKKLGTHDDVDHDGDGVVTLEELKAALQRGNVKLNDELLHEIVSSNDTDGEPGMSPREYDLVLLRAADLKASQYEAKLLAALFLVSIAAWSIALPLVHDWDPEVGVYFSVVTFSTVGLGDVTIPLETSFSMHGHFNYFFFLAVSIELAIVASIVNSTAGVVAAYKKLSPASFSRPEYAKISRLTSIRSGTATTAPPGGVAAVLVANDGATGGSTPPPPPPTAPVVEC